MPQKKGKGVVPVVSGIGPGCVKTPNFPDSGGASPLAHTEIVEYRGSSEAKFSDQNFIRSFHTAWVESRPSHVAEPGVPLNPCTL